MKSKNFLSRFYAAGILMSSLLLNTSCKCNRTPDPCKQLQPVSASFKMVETLFSGEDYYWKDKNYPYSDTSVSKFVTFTADLTDAEEYTWKIGAGVYHEKSFGLNMDNNQNLREFPITLIVKKAPNSSCFPEDDGRDTLTKKLVLTYPSLVDGRFEGTWEGSAEKFIMRIQCPRIVTDHIGNNTYYFVINNYNAKGDSTGFDEDSFYGFRYNMVFFANNGNFVSDLSSLGYDAVYIDGTATMLDHNTVLVDYTYNSIKGDRSSPRLHRRFRGTRLKD